MLPCPAACTLPLLCTSLSSMHVVPAGVTASLLRENSAKFATATVAFNRPPALLKRLRKNAAVLMYVCLWAGAPRAGGGVRRSPEKMLLLILASFSRLPTLPLNAQTRENFQIYVTII